MKKILLSAAVLALTVLLGYASTSVLLKSGYGQGAAVSNAMRDAASYSAALRNANARQNQTIGINQLITTGFDEHSTANASSAPQRASCPDCSKFEKAYQDANNELDTFQENYVNNIETYIPGRPNPLTNPAEYKKRLKELLDTKQRAKEALNHCMELRKMYCTAYEEALKDAARARGMATPTPTATPTPRQKGTSVEGRLPVDTAPVQKNPYPVTVPNNF